MRIVKRFKGCFYLLFTSLFYAYHVREFGFESLTSILALASCVSFICFIFMYSRLGREFEKKRI